MEPIYSIEELLHKFNTEGYIPSDYQIYQACELEDADPLEIIHDMVMSAMLDPEHPAFQHLNKDIDSERYHIQGYIKVFVVKDGERDKWKCYLN